MNNDYSSGPHSVGLYRVEGFGSVMSPVMVMILAVALLLFYSAFKKHTVGTPQLNPFTALGDFIPGLKKKA